MNSLKLIFYLKHKLPEMELYEFYSDMCVPGKSYQGFYEKQKAKAKLVHFKDLSLEQGDNKVTISYTTVSGKKATLDVDMVISSPPVIPPKGSEELAEILGITQKHKGFFGAETSLQSPVISGRDGIYLAGCIQGPKDLADSIAQAEAAAGKILSVCYEI